MHILIIGATGGTGRMLVTQALEEGHTVTAFVRKPADMKMEHDRLTVFKGNVLDAGSVDRAMEGQDAVLSALGHKRFLGPSTILSGGTWNILRSMEAHGVRRFVCETSLGVAESGGRLGLYYSFFVVPFITFFYFADKERQEQMIRASDTDWVIVRPAVLTNGRARGAYEHGEEVGSYIFTKRISRADVAGFMMEQLVGDGYLRKTPALAY